MCNENEIRKFLNIRMGIMFDYLKSGCKKNAAAEYYKMIGVMLFNHECAYIGKDFYLRYIRLLHYIHERYNYFN